ncbi:MaoC family dehydratase [Nonomuraea harbinensis]|uniref:MaoC family dehydratase n=1 Tax=Nonomuraea harbinensis TaxID=1286938 RepID=A0ABW1C2I0_9ACTN|nr:MaoC family dehydratase [Nonomuraea harbinensis]
MPVRVSGLDEIRTLAGTDLGVTDWMEITQDRVNTFADATDDHQWIHVDPVRAAEGPFKTAIAHGYLTMSLVIPLFGRLLQIEGIGMAINYGLNKARFPAPVPVGARIRLAGKVVEVEEVRGGLQLTVDFAVEVENAAKPACVAQAVYRYLA